MALCRYMTYKPTVGRQKCWGWSQQGNVYALDEQLVASTLISPKAEGLDALAPGATGEGIPYTDLDTEPGRYGHPSLVAPIVSGMEIWAAGVTYESSKFARMAEATDGGDVYARVYMAERPELFFKGTPSRTVGTNDAVRVRKDSNWNVPEPELTVLIAATGQILGYTVGNDMSSRDIEGDNPLYLPQAKVYKGSCAIGPVIVPASLVDAHNLGIKLSIERDGEIAFYAETSTSTMKRKVPELVEWLFRDNEFPNGVLMMTGTGIIPPDSFSLKPGDSVTIEIEKLGTLRNYVGE